MHKSFEDMKRRDPFLCRIGLHKWSVWEWGRWAKLGAQSYRRICERGCGTHQYKNILYVEAHHLLTKEGQEPERVMFGKGEED